MFAQRLRALRKERGMTLDDLALQYNERFSDEGKGLNKGTLSKYENGKQKPFIETVHGLAEVFGVSLDYLVGKEMAQSKCQGMVRVQLLDDDFAPAYPKGAVVWISEEALRQSKGEDA